MSWVEARVSTPICAVLLAWQCLAPVPAAAAVPPGHAAQSSATCLATPVITALTPGDSSVQVDWNAPCDAGTVTSYVVVAHDGCAPQGQTTVTGAPPATTVDFAGLNNGSPVSFTVAAVTGAGQGPASALAGPVTPTGFAAPVASDCSTRQYHLTGSNGSTWVDIDPTNLALSITPNGSIDAVITGNVDLWAANAGYNQDVGIAVSSSDAGYPTMAGQPEAWKESGGFAAFSPNAASVQTVIPLLANVTYQVKLQWKANKRDAGSIYAGAGRGPYFSPTRLSVNLVSAAAVFTKSSNAQFTLADSSGSSWAYLDATDSLSVQFTAPSSGTWYAVMSASADLWTSREGQNQDLGIFFSGSGGFPTLPSFTPWAWHESGGFAGAYSPNAAFVQTVAPLTDGVTYGADLRWKTNQFSGFPIYAGAGPLNHHFSPTSLTVILVQAANQSAWSITQHSLQNSNGTSWVAMDSANLATGSGGTDVLVAVNVDLWTKTAGFNQDVGIMASNGVYGTGTLVAWKESGGLAGAYSPNAAYVFAILHLTGASVSVTVVWKANRAGSSVIEAGAGPSQGAYSPTTILAVPLD